MNTPQNSQGSQRLDTRLSEGASRDGQRRDTQHRYDQHRGGQRRDTQHRDTQRRDDQHRDDQRRGAEHRDVHLPDVVDIPAGWVITWELNALRSQEPVHVIRWEPEGPRTLGGEQVSVVLSRADGRLISYRHAYLPPELVAQIRGGETLMPSEGKAAHIAEATMRAIDPRDAAQSLPMRVEHEMREWVAADGSMLDIPVLWHKYAAPGGGYSWVSVGPAGQVIEYERDSQWDFRNWRRESEQWDHDGWIAAHEGTGPQLAPPAALA